MCDCWFCENEFDGDEYLEWEYNRYRETTDKPLPIREWLKQFESSTEKIIQWNKDIIFLKMWGKDLLKND